MELSKKDWQEQERITRNMLSQTLISLELYKTILALIETKISEFKSDDEKEADELMKELL
jgi:hypothetical protein